MADTAQRWFGRPVEVLAVDQLSPGLRRVGFGGAQLRGRRSAPGQEIEFRVEDRHFRHCTLSRLDSIHGAFDVVFRDHGDGPGMRWRRGLRPSASTSVLGPGPGGGLRRLREGPVLLMGDGSTVGLACALAATGRPVQGAIEVPAADADGAGDLVPWVTALPSLPTPGDALRRWLADGCHVPRVGATGTVVLAGHAQTIQDIRGRLRDLGVVRLTICTKAYRATGRTGLWPVGSGRVCADGASSATVVPCSEPPWIQRPDVGQRAGRRRSGGSRSPQRRSTRWTV